MNKNYNLLTRFIITIIKERDIKVSRVKGFNVRACSSKVDKLKEYYTRNNFPQDIFRKEMKIKNIRDELFSIPLLRLNINIV